MSRIDSLIAEHCPDGVEFKPLGELIDRSTNIKWPEVIGQEFRYIDLTSVDRITHKIVESQIITGESAPSRAQQIVRKDDVIFGTTRPMLRRYAMIPEEYDGDICSTGYCVLRAKAELALPNYIFHSLGASDFYNYVEVNERGASYPAITDGAVKAYRIPLPPLEIQREIVKVLDAFTGVEAELEAALGAELEARRRQYQYYRDALLAFGDQHIQWATMGEVGEFFRGRRFTKDDFDEAGIPCIHYGDIYTQYGTFAKKSVSHVRADMEPRLRFALPGDLVIAGVGETVEDVAKAVAWLGEGKVAIHDDCFAFRHSMNPTFVSYWFQTAAFHAEKNKFVARAKVKRLSGESLGKLKIPVPPAAEQQRVVSILDKLDSLVNDLSYGLPAEVHARRRQYAHYRDCLLTFKEAA